ncbi:MAG TPA: hypothetical protein VFO93_02380 [Hymenobacter sp.]|uniref:hypothetical protein n=1 Tax=Hymenobacter sp. TaxID=1898978 RepID=UPI002D7EF2F4|nr:hypothetical protein [Hymenobacter sp.]HET9502360.1 hypothetical protein [Hymenobacter sp.]
MGLAQSKPTTIRLSPEDLERGQYGAQRNFFFLPPGQTGEDNYQSAGFFGQKLRPYLKTSPTALAELDKYSRQKTLYLIDRGVLLGSVIVYGSQVFGHGDAQYFNGTQQVAIGAAAVSLVATLFINRRTNDYLKQAVDTYNTDGTATRHGALWQRLRPAGVGLGATAQGAPTLGLRWQL